MLSRQGGVPYSSGIKRVYSDINLQLHATVTSNPYMTTANSNLTILAKLLFNVVNMARYAQLNIENYNTITSIPNGHLPSDLNTSDAVDWQDAFGGCYSLTSLPSPFYNMANSEDISYMFARCQNIKDASMVKFGNNTIYMENTFSQCHNLINAPVIPNSVIYMQNAFCNCTNLITAPIIPASAVNIEQIFLSCNNLRGNIYIYCNNLDPSAYTMLYNTGNYAKNIYVHNNTNAYNLLSYVANSNSYAKFNVHCYGVENVHAQYLLEYPNSK